MPLIVENGFLFGADGLVQSGDQIWFHFQKYPWDLSCQEKNPGAGMHRRIIESRLRKGLHGTSKAPFLQGTYHLGISPHIYSYYHLMTDLLPHLIDKPRNPVLVPKFMPQSFIEFLKQAKFEVKILPKKTIIVELLCIPEMNLPEWDSNKVKKIQTFFKNLITKNDYEGFNDATPLNRIYISRKLAVKRHLTNEEEFLPLLKKHKFRRVYLEEMSIMEQFILFSKASHIIAAHGAGLTNVLFAPTDVRILEIRPELSSGQFV
jgi:Capsular polysaccharide biosynthesis protein